MARIAKPYVVVGTVICVTDTLLALGAEHCKLFSMSDPYNGRYCPGDGMVIPHLLTYQCRYVCIVSPTCKAYNYNATERTCTRLASPCLQAISDSVMDFAVLTANPVDQCYEWVPYSSGDTVEPRMVFTDDTYRAVSRMQRGGEDRVGYFDAQKSACYASWESSDFINTQGYPCQLLRIIQDCTVFWVPYTAGNPINPRSVNGGRMVNGDMVYVTKFDYNYPPVLSLVGHYVQGADHTISPAGSVTRSSASMMMLIML